MPLLYGEEEKSFRRLQGGIIRTTPDYSIFAWTIPPGTQQTQLEAAENRLYSGVLAPSPLEFSKCGSVYRIYDGDTTSDFYASNRGIKMHARVRLEAIPGKHGNRYTFPVCLSSAGITLGIALRKCGPGQFVRENPQALKKVTRTSWEGTPRSRYVLTQLPESEPAHSPPFVNGYDIILQSRPHVLQICLPPEMEVDKIWPWTRWDDEDQVFFLAGNSNRNFGAAIITGNLRVHMRRHAVTIPLDCMLYALGWAQVENRQLQCTVFDRRRLDTALYREMTAGLEEKDHHSPRIRSAFIDHGIPQSSVVVFTECFESANIHAVVSFTTKLARDQKISINPFWRVEFEWQICSDGEVPEIRDTKWADGHDTVWAA
jgi:hypothetical protein